MGMDVTFGVMFGAKIYGGLVEKDPVDFHEEVTKYNPDTGEPIRVPVSYWAYELKCDLGGHKAGELLRQDFIENLVASLEMDNYTEGFIYSEDYLGFKAFKGEAPYDSPQDMCFELIEDTYNASEKWNSLFPQIPGKLYVYLHASY